MNDPTRRKTDGLILAILLVTMSALGPMSTDLYLPALPTIGATFGASVAETQLTLSIFLVGFAGGMLLYGPLSDRFGRRPLILAGIAIYVAAGLGCAMAGSMAELTVFRFFQAIGACAGPVLARAIVRDIRGPTDAARLLAYLSMAMALAPAVGPVVGGVLTDLSGWRSNFWVLVIFGVMAGSAAWVILGETNRHLDPTATSPAKLLSNYRTLLGSRDFTSYCLIAAAAYSGIFTFISGSSFVLINGVGLDPISYGFCFGAVVVGYMTGTFMSGRLVGRFGLDRLISVGLVIALIGGATEAMLAFAMPPSVATVVVPMAVFMIGVGLTLANSMAGAIGPFPRMAGSASSVLGFLQMTLAAVTGILVGAFTINDARAMGVSLTLVSLAAIAAHRFALNARQSAPATSPDPEAAPQ